MLGSGIEYELQFPDINKKEIIKKLKKLGAKRVHKKLLYSSIYYWNYKENYFIRIRNEYDNITVTKKILRDNKMPIEYEIDSSSSLKTIDEFVRNMIDLPKFSKIEIEKFREKWTLKNMCNEIVFDTWPGLDEFMEIDCSTKKDLDKIMSLLNLHDKKHYTKGAFDYYQDIYGIKDRKVLKNSILKFSTFEKTLQPHVTKNRSLLKKKKL